MLASVWQRCSEKISPSGQRTPVSGKDWISERGYIPPHPHRWTKLTAQDFPVGNLQLDSQSLHKLLPGGGAGRKNGSTALSTVQLSLPCSLPPYLPPFFSALSFLNTQERLTPLRTPEKVIIINEELKESD